VTIADYVRALRQHWIMIVACVLLASSGALAFSFSQVPIYQAQSQMYVSITGTSSIGELSQGGTLAQQRVKSYAELVTSPGTLQPVIDRLSLPYSAESLASRIKATSPIGTVLINVAVMDASPARARDIANTITQVFPSLVQRLDKSSSSAQSLVLVSPTRLAVAPAAPISPRTELNVLLGLLVGFGLGVGLSVLRDTLDRTVKSKEHAQDSAGAPLLSAVGDDPESNEHRLITHDAFSARAEAFRQLRTNIRFLSVDHQVGSLVVTSAVPHEGKTSTACNLAIALAQAGESVVLVDADLRRPTVADVFALTSGVGLTSVLMGDINLDDALQTWREDLPLRVLTAGPVPPNPSELIGSARMASLISGLTADGVTVVLDSPPLLPVTDAALLARATDGALVVARAASTHTEQLAAACESLRTAGASVLGVVLNRVPRKRSPSYYVGFDSYGGNRSKKGPTTSATPGQTSATPAVTVTCAEPASAALRTRADARVELSQGAPPVPGTRVVLPAPGEDTMPSIPVVREKVEAKPSLERLSGLRSRRASRGRSHHQGIVSSNGHTTANQASFAGRSALEPLANQRDNGRPPIVTSSGPIADMVVDADRGTISRLEAVDVLPSSAVEWPIEWGHLPALISSPRAELGQNGQNSNGNGNGARHRN
jgi:capsular exopolysaccharide synthesis family protein